MFKNVSINLKGPICSCQQQSLSWGIAKGGDLNIQCDTCKAMLTIAHDGFVAHFKLDEQYPGGLALSKTPGSNVESETYQDTLMFSLKNKPGEA